MTTLDDNIDLNDDIADIDSIIEKQKRVLRRILDSHIAGSKILVTKMHMGKTLEASPKSIPSYVGALSLETINQNIYIFGIAMDKEEKQEVINEANKIYDVKEVIPSIYLASELSRNKL